MVDNFCPWVYSNFVTGWIIQLIFDSEDHLVSGSEDATIRLWDLISGDVIHVIPQDTGISCLVASKLKGQEDDVVLFGDRDGKMSYLDMQTLTVSLIFWQKLQLSKNVIWFSTTDGVLIDNIFNVTEVQSLYFSLE